jgi:hypothetical protein
MAIAPARTPRGHRGVARDKQIGGQLISQAEE